MESVNETHLCKLRANSAATWNPLDAEFPPVLSNNSNTDLITGASSLLLLTDLQQTTT